MDFWGYHPLYLGLKVDPLCFDDYKAYPYVISSIFARLSSTYCALQFHDIKWFALLWYKHLTFHYTYSSKTCKSFSLSFGRLVVSIPKPPLCLLNYSSTEHSLSCNNQEILHTLLTHTPSTEHSPHLFQPSRTFFIPTLFIRILVVEVRNLVTQARWRKSNP